MTAPDPGLADLIAAHKIQLFGVDGPHYQAETEYDGCLCGWQGAEEDHPAHVALVVEQHTIGRMAELEAELAEVTDKWGLISHHYRKAEARVAELEAELEKYHAEERRQLEWARFCAQQDVRCTECGLRYGERKDYSCSERGAHEYDADELRAALEGEQQ